MVLVAIVLLPKNAEKRADLTKDFTFSPAPEEVLESLKWIYQLLVGLGNIALTTAGLQWL